MDQYVTFLFVGDLPDDRRDQVIEEVCALGWQPTGEVERGLVRVERPFETTGDALRGAKDVNGVVGSEGQPGPSVLADFADRLEGQRLIVSMAGSSQITDYAKALVDSALKPVATDAPAETQIAIVEKDDRPARAPEGGRDDRDERDDRAAADDRGERAPPPSRAAPLTPTSELAAIGLDALDVPQWLWKRLPADSDDALVRQTLRGVYEQRARHAERIQWQLAPELALLDELDPAKRKLLAEDLLKARAGIAPHQLAIEKQRADLLREAVELTDEMTDQLTKWRQIADWGVGILCVTVAVSVIGLFIVLSKLGDSGFDEWSAVAIIFALALFAVSPAVLLLRERPLQGIDQFMPGGKAEAGGPAADGAGRRAADRRAADRR